MDALDAAFGATERAVGDAHALSFRKLAVFIAKVFQPGLSRRGDKHKHVHLPVGDGIRLASAVIAMAGVEDGAVGELTLHRYGALLGSAEKHQRIYHGTAHLAALPSSLHHGFFHRHVALCAVGRQLLLHSKNFVVEHLQGIPMQFVIFRFNHSRKDITSIPAHRGFFNLQRTASRVSPLIFHLSKTPELGAFHYPWPLSVTLFVRFLRKKPHNLLQR